LANYVIVDPYSASGTLDEIAAYIADNPDRTFFEIGGYMKSTFITQTGTAPTKEDLDAIERERPIIAVDLWGHSAWVNSAALELANITADTPDPVDGVIQRDENGEPTGQLLEYAYGLVTRALPLPDQEATIEAFVNRQPYFHEQGVTTVHEMASSFSVAPQMSHLVTANTMAESGQLDLRLLVSFAPDPSVGNASEQLDEFFALSGSFPESDVFRARSVKFFIDGTLEEFTGLTLDPYLCLSELTLLLDCEPGGHGLDFFGDAGIDLVPLFRKINRKGYQINAHAIGDAAVRKALDDLETARVDPDLRPSLDHVQMATPFDIERMAERGVTVNASPYWMALDDFSALFYIPGLGFDIAYNNTYPLQSLVDAGVNVTAASDGDLDSMFQIYTGMTRLYPPRIYSLWYCCYAVGQPGGFNALYPYTPDLDAVFTIDDYDLENNSVQHISTLPPASERVGAIETMIEILTINAAKAKLMGDVIGSLEVGKKADVVIMDTDIVSAGNQFEITRDLADLEPVANALVLMTIFDGRVVFVRGTGAAVKLEPQPNPPRDIE
jgi:predicted amidohydrolase YtcJ